MQQITIDKVLLDKVLRYFPVISNSFSKAFIKLPMYSASYVVSMLSLITITMFLVLLQNHIPPKCLIAHIEIIKSLINLAIEKEKVFGIKL